MHQQQQRPWQHQGPMGYSPPSPPNGSYMNMVGVVAIPQFRGTSDLCHAVRA
jgi:hypothetical protein